MTDRGKILLAFTGRPDVEARLAALAPLLGPIARPDPDLLDAATRAETTVVVTTGSAGAAAGFIAALPRLALIACLGSGFEGVDMAAARARGAMVTFSPGANASSVADHAMGLLIASVRKVAEGDRFVRAGHWPKGRRPMTGRGLAGRRLGIFGLGAIGEKVATRARAFDMEIAYHNRAPRADAPWLYFDTLRGLAEYSDALVISCRAGENTRGLVDAGILAALGSDAHVVNIARGSVIDEAALVEALQSGRLAGAGLDVFEGEPHVGEALRALPNVVLTPHLAGTASEARAAMLDMMMDNLAAYFDGRAPANLASGTGPGES